MINIKQLNNTTHKERYTSIDKILLKIESELILNKQLWNLKSCFIDFENFVPLRDLIINGEKINWNEKGLHLFEELNDLGFIVQLNNYGLRVSYEEIV